MKNFLWKLLELYIKYKLNKKDEENNKLDDEHKTDYDKIDLDDFDDWTEDEAEDFYSWGKRDLLHN